ncbi:MAG: heavy-metal-associated domain-containing protein [Parasporobacterium sp.]|nr:heavy-metal-associated domain-containing protein [Parasporobacterium sp.]
MVKTTLYISNLSCGMCESHINDAIRNTFKIKKVSSSHTKKKTEILSNQPLDEDKLKETIAGTGYTLTGIESAVYEKKRLFH